MKKDLALLLVATFGVSLASCNGANTSSSSSSNEDKDYYVVNFNYNREDNDSNYLSVIVLKDQVLNAPKAPEIEDYIFEDWYKEPTCQNKYLRWGLEIDKDFTLYANWTTFNSLDIATKVAKFQEKIKEYGKAASRVNQETTATIAYPFMGEDGIFTVKDKYIYRRYKNVMEKEYYQYNENDTPVIYGKEQFYYDQTRFYDVYKDFEDPTQNETNTSTFRESEVETFLSIDFSNFYSKCENSIVYYANQSDKFDEETLQWEFTGNFTKLNSSLETYTYAEGYYVSQLSQTAGNYVTEQYEYNIGLIFENNKIKRANVQSSFLYAIGQEVYQYVEDTTTYEFFYNNGIYPDFTGELLQ